MPDYRISVTAQLTPLSALDESRVRALTGGAVKAIAVDMFRIDVTSHGRDAGRAADNALIAINRALAPTVRFARPPVWVARRRGPLGLRRRTTGLWSIGNGDDDGLGGVREPRRPRPSTGSAAAAVDPNDD